LPLVYHLGRCLMIYTECTYNLIHTNYMLQRTKHQTRWSSANTKICTQEKLSLDLGMGYGYLWLSSLSPSECWNSTSITENHFLPNPLQLIIHQSHIWCYIVFNPGRIIKKPTCLSSSVSLLAERHNTCTLLPNAPICCAQMCIQFADGHFEKCL
jgi:hypothetical protein